MLSFLHLTRRSSESLSNLFKVTQQIRGQAISPTLEPVPLMVMTPPCLRKRRKGRRKPQAAQVAPAVLGVWVYENRLPTWSCVGGTSTVLGVVGSSLPKVPWKLPKKGREKEKAKVTWLAVMSLLLRQCPGQLADILFLAGGSGVNKATKGWTGRRRAAWRTFSVLCPSPQLWGLGESPFFIKRAKLSLKDSWSLNSFFLRF